MDGEVIRAGVIKTTAALVHGGFEDSDTPLIHMYELFKLNEVHVDAGVRMEEVEENERGTNISPQIDEEDILSYARQDNDIDVVNVEGGGEDHFNSHGPYVSAQVHHLVEVEDVAETVKGPNRSI
ncbi:unnamed protein product [Linum trigynum]|uniref:Uncharacterized protein n=1 Tax=Linum trigynum TaxID=586398 RepID=A0AAV2GBY3_9ROSI